MRRLKEEPDPSDESPVASPFPFKRAYVIGLVLFINGVSQNMAIPLGPAMTAHFFPELSEEELDKRLDVLAMAKVKDDRR